MSTHKWSDIKAAEGIGTSSQEQRWEYMSKKWAGTFAELARHDTTTEEFGGMTVTTIRLSPEEQAARDVGTVSLAPDRDPPGNVLRTVAYIALAWIVAFTLGYLLRG